MQSETLKTLLRIYSKLPVGIIVYKDEQIYFINEHLRNILTLGDLPADECIPFICGIVGIDDTSDGLYRFFTSIPFFVYREKYIQIIYRCEPPFTIFVFSLVNAVLLEQLGAVEPVDETIHPVDADLNDDGGDAVEHAKLLKYFDDHHSVRVTGSFLYRGIPLIADNTVVRPFKNSLAVKVEKKQLVSAVQGELYTMMLKSGYAIQGTVMHVETKKRLIFLGRLQRVKEGFHQRDAIRYTLEDVKASLSFDGVKQRHVTTVLDLSDRALRLQVTKASVLNEIDSFVAPFKAELQLDGESIVLTCRLLKTSQNEGEAEVVLLVSGEQQEKAKLRAWQNSRQIRLIKSVREHSRMLE